MKLCLLGCGTVGQSFKEIYESLGHHVSKILVRDIEKYPLENVTNNFYEILDEKPDIIVETIGGVEDAYDYIRSALEKRIHVVTANKDVIAEKGDVLNKIALENGVNLKFEAAIGGGIPIISSLEHYLGLDEIYSVDGILNGTTNYILTAMNQGDTFEKALQEAKLNGFCEENPISDLAGHDVARKLSVLTQKLDHSFINWHAISKTHIEEIDSIWFQYARDNGLKVKLIAEITFGETIKAGLEPILVGRDDKAFVVDNEENYIHFVSKYLKSTKLSGLGAGGNPTGYAVVQDVLNIRVGKMKPLIEKTVEPLEVVGEWLAYNGTFVIYEGERKKNSIRLRR